MIKTILIVLLSLALAAAAFLTRPSEASFRAAVRQHIQSQQADTGLPKFISDQLVEWKTDAYMSQVEYKDRYLFATIEKDGQSLYSGAFGHWFGSPEKYLKRGDELLRNKAGELEQRMRGLNFPVKI
jgi:hypothetical protein